MEAIVSNLLRDFEDGRMTRRQLVKSLAVAAVGAHTLGSPASAEASTTPPRAAFKTTSLDHISYAVSDYGRSRDFYADLMGWEVQNDDGERQVSMRMGDAGTIIIRNSRTPMRQERDDRPPLTGVINHISWSIEDFDTDAVREELERRGLNPRRDQGGGADYDSYHVLDPDGWDVQIAI